MDIYGVEDTADDPSIPHRRITPRSASSMKPPASPRLIWLWCRFFGLDWAW